jgi:hypothetical protein
MVNLPLGREVSGLHGVRSLFQGAILLLVRLNGLSLFNYALASNPTQFNRYYTFSDAYALQGPLDSSLVQLSSELATNKDKQALYRAHYFSGHHYSIPATGTFKQIADANWPVYYCGSEKMNLLEFVSCMKSY